MKDKIAEILMNLINIFHYLTETDDQGNYVHSGASYNLNTGDFNREYNLSPSDAEDIFAAMGKILYEAAQLTREKEPYATKTIKELEHFSFMIDDYEHFLEIYS